MVDLELIHRLEITVVCSPWDRVCDVPPKNLGDPLCDTLLDSDCREAGEVLLIGFVLCVAVVCDLWIDGAAVGAGAFGGRS